MRVKPRSATIYDVATRAGVSISTVSLVWNAPHRVRPSTRERVVAAAAELGYRSGGGGRPRDAGLVRIVVAAPYGAYPSYFRRLAGVLRRAHDIAVEVVPFDLPSAAASDAPLLDALPARRGVDGVIVMGVPLGSAAVRSSRDARLPVVLVDVERRRPRADDVPTILVDDRAGGRMLAEHLVARGHEQVVYLHEPQRSLAYVSAGQRRSAGVEELLRVQHVAVRPDADPAEALERALRRHPACTAVLANHDELASRALRALRSAGRRVPDDMAVTGYDDGDVAEALDLTTVRQPFEASGRAALEAVLDLVAGVDARMSRVELLPQLVVRSTT